MNRIKPALIILCGIPFSGKSTLAKQLEKDLLFKRVDLDEIKCELMGHSVKDEDIQQNEWDAIYQKMYLQIRRLLNEGLGVIHDTGNFTVHERGLVNQIAKEIGAPYITVFLNTPKATAKTRLLENRTKKIRFDVTDQAFDSAVAEMEPPGQDENPLVFDNSESSNHIKESIERVLNTVGK